MCSHLLQHMHTIAKCGLWNLCISAKDVLPQLGIVIYYTAPLLLHLEPLTLIFKVTLLIGHQALLSIIMLMIYCS